MFVYFKYGVCICNFQNGEGNIKISQVIVTISLQINGDSLWIVTFMVTVTKIKIVLHWRKWIQNIITYLL